MFVELHILQNFAPSCLNRDDTNAPKDCEFGGFRRARISSQCIKRSFRKYFAEHAVDLTIDNKLGERTRKWPDEIIRSLVEKGKNEQDASLITAVVLAGTGYFVDKKDPSRTSVLIYVRPDEKIKLANAIYAEWDTLILLSKRFEKNFSNTKRLKNDENEPDDESGRGEGGQGKKDKLRKEIRKALPHAIGEVLDSFKSNAQSVADIALFGRMVAELTDLNVNAACQVAHAISTHEVDMEMDFYTAVDDLQPKEEPGAGMMGIVEFNSSCFYRYALLDTAQLETNLAGNKALAKSAVLAFVKAAIFAIPTGKQNSMAAQNLPLYVRVVAKKDAPPRSLANAFMKPVRANKHKDDLALASVEALKAHDEELTRMYGNPGVKLDVASSVYKDYGKDNIDDLLSKLGGIL